MELFYDSYEPIAGSAHWNLEGENPNPAFWPKTVDVYVLLDVPYVESHIPKHLLVTWARPFTVPDNGEFTCHSCGVLLGASVFAKNAHGWVVEVATLDLGEYGTFGQPPTVTLQPVGAQHYGLRIRKEFASTGAVERSLALFLPIRGAFVKAFSSAIEENEDPKYDPESNAASSSVYDGDIDMQPNPHSDYYDILLTKRTYNPKAPKAPAQVVVTRFRFNGEKYVSGDPTVTLDR
ncbi:MAG: hypothetical protein WA655_00205 [Candidatus Korobacteraceae bacterium]